jgi:hypothetical protein
MDAQAMRFAARRDLNDKEISEAVRAAGFQLLDFGRAGGGLPDKLALRELPDGTYFTCWIEIKSAKGKLKANQLLAREIWEPRGEWLEARDPQEIVRELFSLWQSKIRPEFSR